MPVRGRSCDRRQGSWTWNQLQPIVSTKLTLKRLEALTIVGVESTAHHHGRHRLATAVVLRCSTSNPLAALNQVVGGTLNFCNTMSAAVPDPRSPGQPKRANSRYFTSLSTSSSRMIGFTAGCRFFSYAPSNWELNAVGSSLDAEAVPANHCLRWLARPDK